MQYKGEGGGWGWGNRGDSVARLSVVYRYCICIRLHNYLYDGMAWEHPWLLTWHCVSSVFVSH